MVGSDLASVGGIVAATMVLVSVLKRLLADVGGLRRVPTWLYAVGVAAGLTAFARLLLGAFPGNGWEMLLQAVCNAAVASGFWSWLKYGANTPGADEPPPPDLSPHSPELRRQNWRMNALLALPAGACLLALAGCSPDQSYRTADRATFDAIAPEYVRYVHADPALTPDQVARRDRTVHTWQQRVDPRSGAPTK